MKCGCCGEEIYSHGMCSVHDCKNGAQFEGYYEVCDFAGIKTGLIQLRRVCEDHKTILIGGTV